MKAFAVTECNEVFSGDELCEKTSLHVNHCLFLKTLGDAAIAHLVLHS
jgi:hypothetical protein